jgi:diguanylate cyclase (GGDEF)-like protein
MNDSPLSPPERLDLLLDATTLGLAILREDDPAAVWFRAREMLRDRFGARSIALVVGSAGPAPPELFFRTGEVELTESDDLEEVTVDSVNLDWSGPWPPWQQARPGAVLDLSDSTTLQAAARRMARRMDAQLWLPLHLDLRTVGLLSLGRRDGGRPWTEADRFFLRWFARHLEVGLRGALHNRQRLSERRRLDRSIHTLSLLLDVTRALSAAHQLRSVLELILEGAMETVGARKASLALHDVRDQMLRIHLVKGLPDPELEEAINAGRHECMAFPSGEGIAGMVYQTRQPIRVRDTRADARFTAPDKSYADSILCVPLIADGDAIGVLNVTNPSTERAFDASDQDHLMMLAAQAAGAINRARLYELASTDELTGLYVRRLILQRLKQEVRRFQRYGRPIAVAVMDLDHFKAVNDTYGHAAGDEVLRTLGRLLQEKTRRELDIPGRIGGEEFLLIMPETDEAGAVLACDRLRRAVAAERIDFEGEELRVTLSIGVAARDAGDESPAALLRRADEALYAAKDAGRDRVTAWVPVEADAPADPESDTP